MTLSLHATTFNTVTADGGCIHATGAVLADQTTVADCQAGRSGGGIFSVLTVTVGSGSTSRAQPTRAPPAARRWVPTS